MYEDKSYDWTLKGPPSSWYIKQATGLARGADRSGHETVGTISLKHLYEIAKVPAGAAGVQAMQPVSCLFSRAIQSPAAYRSSDRGTAVAGVGQWAGLVGATGRVERSCSFHVTAPDAPSGAGLSLHGVAEAARCVMSCCRESFET